MLKSQEKIVLLGFMGCGKSTIGKALSKRLKKKFIDLDSTIEAKQKATITQIFQISGEEVFRNIESDALSLALGLDSFVLSLGGGTPCYNKNMERISTSATSVYIRLGADLLAERLFKEKNHRPLISSYKSKIDLAKFIRTKLLERERYYMSALHVVDGNQEVEALLNEITDLLDS